MKIAKPGRGAAYLAALLAAPLFGCASYDPCPTSVSSSGHSGSAARTRTSLPVHHAVTESSSVGVSGDDLVGAPLSIGQLQPIAGDLRSGHAIILIGGIHDSYHYFDSWVDALSPSGNLILGWDHDHRSMPMADSAEVLAHDIRLLGKAGATHITIVAHSIGGLISKGAIDALAQAGDAQKFTQLDLHALGTPWGGFAVVRVALKVPGSKMLSTLVGYPMAFELVPDSDYLTSLRRPMPANGRLHLYVGGDDTIALPTTSRTKRRYALTEANATTITTIAGFRHNDYGKAPSLASRTRDVGGAGQQCRDRPCKLVTNLQRCAAPVVATAVVP